MDEWDERRQRNREAQARYRARNAKLLVHARKVANILVRQSWRHDDIKIIVAALRASFTKEGIAELRKELARRD